VKIALFTDCYTPEVGGVQVAVNTLRQGLLGRGHDVTVFATSHPDATPEPGIVRLPSATFTPVPEIRMATPVDLIARSLINRASFDLIHTHTELMVGQFGWRAATRLRLPLVHTYHTMYEDLTWYVARDTRLTRPAGRLVEILSRRVCNNADCVIAPTRKTRDKLLGYGVDTPIRIAPTGVDTSRFAREAADPRSLDRLRASLGIAPDAQVLLSLGRVAVEKNVPRLVDEVAAYLKPADPDLAERRGRVVLLIAGDGRAMRLVKDRVASAGIADRVYFAGEVPWQDVPQYYHLSDVFVSLSATETQGLTYIEALAAGVPLVAQNNECFEGILEDGISASLFQHPAAFHERLDDVLFTGQRARYIAGGYAVVEALSVERCAESVETIYEETREAYPSDIASRHLGRRPRLGPALPVPAR